MLAAVFLALLQQPADPPPEKPKDDATPVTVTYKDGLQFKAADGAFELYLHGHVMLHYRAVGHRPDDATRTATDTLLVRQARLELFGSFHKDFEFKTVFDFPTAAAATNGTLMDCYVGWKRWKELSIRVGQFKEPFGQEEVIGDSYVDFPERGVCNRLVPQRDIGVMAFGKFADGLFEYSLGLYNGAGRSVNDTNDEKDVVLRLRTSPLAGLRIGVAGTYGDVDTTATTTAGDLVTTELNIMFVDATAGTFDGIRTRLGIEVTYVTGPFGIRGEYIRRTDEVDNGVFDGEKVTYSGWSIAAAFVVTGENYPMEARLVPAKPLFADGGFGAVTVVARASQLKVSSDLFDTGVASAVTNSDTATVFTFGVNWQAHRNIRIMANVVLESFADKITFSNGDQEDQFIGFLGRLQLDF